MILNEIYKALNKPDRKKEYFYVTDLGSCPRKVIMNFGEYEKKPLTNAEKIMFHKADSDHTQMSRLLNQSDRYSVMKEEYSVNEGLPDMWHGRLDCLVYDRDTNEMFPVDWKGTRSLRYQSDLPKEQHVLQLQAYIWALNQMNYPVNRGVIIYVDRSGSYDGLEFDIEGSIRELIPEMKIYEKAYKESGFKVLMAYPLPEILPEIKLPPILPREIKQSKNIFNLIPNWQCGYCKYQGLSCNPNMSTNKAAEINDKELIIRKGYEEYDIAINQLIKPKEYTDDKKGFADFVNDVNKGGK